MSGPSRPPRHHASHDPRVGLFVDFNDLRRSLADEMPDIELTDLAQRLREFAEDHGRLVIATAYGDWSQSAEEAREFRRQHIEPRLVIDKEDDDEHTEVVLSLDVQESLFQAPHLDTYLVVSGHAMYPEISQRLRRADRQLIQIHLQNGEPSYAEQLGYRQTSLNDVLEGRKLRRPGRRVDFDEFDWTPFIRLMDELEENMPFVGFGWLLKKKLHTENSGGCVTMQERQELMDRAVDQGVLTLYKVDNIEEGADPVTACKLNRENAVVREVTGAS